MQLSVLILACGAMAAGPAEQGDSNHLSKQLELIRDGAIFMELEESGLGIYVAGWKVKFLPATVQQLSVGESASLTVVDYVIPLSPPRRVVLDSALIASKAQDTTASVSSLDQIIGVDEMPSTFLVEFDEGTLWMVNLEGWPGLANLWSQGRLRLRALRIASGQLIQGGGFRLRFLRMAPDTARELFWVIETGLPTLQ